MTTTTEGPMHLEDINAFRFWAKVDKNGPTPEHHSGLGPCWMWTRSRDDRGYGDGYGYFGVKRKVRKAHRVAWVLTCGPIPDDTPHVLHHCDHPSCCNPSHLFLGTHAQNMADMAAKGRSVGANRGKTRCPQDHPYDRVYGPKRYRRCQVCNTEQARARRKVAS
jgi:hypothetical protein